MLWKKWILLLTVILCCNFFFNSHDQDPTSSKLSYHSTRFSRRILKEKCINMRLIPILLVEYFWRGRGGGVLCCGWWHWEKYYFVWNIFIFIRFEVNMSVTWKFWRDPLEVDSNSTLIHGSKSKSNMVFLCCIILNGYFWREWGLWQFLLV